MPRIWFVFPTLNRYQTARFRACRAAGLDAGVIEISRLGSYPIPGWRSPEADSLADIVTLFDNRSFGQIPTAELKHRIEAELGRRKDEIGALALLGWGNREANAAHCWALRNGVPCVLLSESTEQDRSRTWIGEWVKRRLVSGFDSALVGGREHAKYLEKLGFPANKISVGYNTVDNSYFAVGAAEVRRDASSQRIAVGIQEPFFLSACRLVPQKNLIFLIDAYALYRRQFSELAVPREYGMDGGAAKSPCSPTPWPLVILGDGPLREALMARRAELSLEHWVHLPGFKTYDEMPRYYGLAGAFVLPSQSEPWGLVVNEAMASGLPVLVSNRCGCSLEIVEDGVNGYRFEPCDQVRLAALMVETSLAGPRTAAMGRASGEIISRWGPERFAEGLKQAFRQALERRPRKSGVLVRGLLLGRLHATSRLGLIK